MEEFPFEGKASVWGKCPLRFFHLPLRAPSMAPLTRFACKLWWPFPLRWELFFLSRSRCRNLFRILSSCGPSLLSVDGEVSSKGNFFFLTPPEQVPPPSDEHRRCFLNPWIHRGVPLFTAANLSLKDLVRRPSSGASSSWIFSLPQKLASRLFIGSFSAQCGEYRLRAAPPECCLAECFSRPLFQVLSSPPLFFSL